MVCSDIELVWGDKWVVWCSIGLVEGGKWVILGL